MTNHCESPDAAPKGFIHVCSIIPDALLDIRYCSPRNFVGERIDGYERPTALLTTEAAEALKAVGDEVGKRGLLIKIYDAYRPARAVAHFVRWAKDLSDTRMKEYYYPHVDKSELFARGYIAARSGHSRGSTVDLTLFDTKSGRDVDMGGTFDWFGEESSPSWCGDAETGRYTGSFPGDAPAKNGEINETQFRNRMLLRGAMLQNGFMPIKSEWWHFTLADEPCPDTYFDHPVR